MHVGALERSYGLLVDLAARHHGGDRHVASAERLADEHEVRLEFPVLECEPLPGASESGLDLVNDEHRPVASTQLLRGLQIALGRKVNRAALDWLDDEGGDILRAQLRLQAREVAERDALAARQQRAEAILEELFTDQRERPERDAVKAPLTGDQPRPTRRRARELHRRVHGLGARAREEHGVE